MSEKNLIQLVTKLENEVKMVNRKLRKVNRELTGGYTIEHTIDASHIAANSEWKLGGHPLHVETDLNANGLLRRANQLVTDINEIHEEVKTLETSIGIEQNNTAEKPPTS